MKNRKTAGFLAVIFCAACIALPAAAEVTTTSASGDRQPITGVIGAEDLDKPFYTLERAETIIYGGPQTGGLLPRINRAEKDVFGRSLPGSITERQTAMLNFLEKGSATQPSLLFKLSTAEWATAKRVHPEWALARRVDTIEMTIDGTTSTGALATRTEKVMTKLLPEGVHHAKTELPKATVVKAALTKTLTVRNVKVNDRILLSLANEIISNDVLIAPKGSRIFAHITKVKPPRSFGRGSVIEMAFDSLETIVPDFVPVGIGDASKKAMEMDGATAGAAGASFAGAILLGPIGLASGALIRGTDNQLKEGTVFYIETAQNVSVDGYRFPSQISSFAVQSGDVQPQGNSNTIVPQNGVTVNQ